MTAAKYVYVASSWRNPYQPLVVGVIRAAGIGCYDFKNPEGSTGFHWSKIVPSYPTVGPGTPEPLMAATDYVDALEHPVARAGFASDRAAMEKADTCVLVLPCGRSAHLELGWMAGQGKRTAILLDGDQVVPELMYLLCDKVFSEWYDMIPWLLG